MIPGGKRETEREGCTICQSGLEKGRGEPVGTDVFTGQLGLRAVGHRKRRLIGTSDACIYLGQGGIGRAANCWVPRAASTVRVMQARFATVRGGLMWIRQGGKVEKKRARGRKKRTANCKIGKGKKLLVPTIPIYYPRTSEAVPQRIATVAQR